MTTTEHLSLDERVAAAEDAFEDAKDRVREIQEQLGNHNKLNPDGSKMTLREWNDWRQRAKHALTYALQDQEDAKRQLQIIKREMSNHSTVDRSDAPPLVIEAVSVTDEYDRPGKHVIEGVSSTGRQFIVRIPIDGGEDD